MRRGRGAATADGRAALDGADGGGGRRSRRRSGAVEDEDGRDGRRGGRIRDGQELLQPSRERIDDGGRARTEPGEDGRRNGRRMDGDGRICDGRICAKMKATTAPDGEGMERTDAPDEGGKNGYSLLLLLKKEARRRTGRRRRPTGRGWLLSAAAVRTTKGNGFGDGGCRPQEQDGAPRGSTAVTRRVVDLDRDLL